MEDDYESLPSNNMSHHMAAGAIAGILEHSVVYPVDSVKTRLQCIKPVKEVRYSGLVDGLSQLIRNEGFGRSLRGIGAVIGGSGPAHAMYFSTYEWVKKTTSNSSSTILKSFSYGIAGACATVLHDAVMTPVDAIKQRMQIYRSPYQNSAQCLSQVITREGIPVLYRAYFTQLSMSLPMHFIHVSVYELCHDLLNKDREYRPLVHVVAGAVGGGVAAFATNPMDVCKTILNTQDFCSLNKSSSRQSVKSGTQISGFWQASKAIYRNSGLSGFFRGASARVVYTAPGTAISWSVYEFFKYLLRGGSSGQNISSADRATTSPSSSSTYVIRTSALGSTVCDTTSSSSP